MGRFQLFFFLGLSAAGAAAASDVSRGELHGGVKLGYSLGQNGAGWPKRNPLRNDNRGGFYIEQTRLRAGYAYDSTLRIAAQLSAIGWVLPDFLTELYVEKQWGAYRWKLGKFPGAGLRTGPGTDEFSLIAVRQPSYAWAWAGTKRLPAWRDFGAQVERSHFGGRFAHRLFFHNANWQNVFNGEPNDSVAEPTQALGIDYGWEWKSTKRSVLGGHLGAAGNREWSEFFGGHGFWNVPYWFKSNPLVDGSLFHEFEVGKAWFQGELMALENRDVRTPDSNYVKSWGLSMLGRYRVNGRWAPYTRYELFARDDFDPTHVSHLIALGSRWTPRIHAQGGLFWTFQYTRVLEQGFRNRASNDVAYAQLQAEF